MSRCIIVARALLRPVACPPSANSSMPVTKLELGCATCSKAACVRPESALRFLIHFGKQLCQIADLDIL
jgi:hypothetical protein